MCGLGCNTGKVLVESFPFWDCIHAVHLVWDDLAPLMAMICGQHEQSKFTIGAHCRAFVIGEAAAG